MTNEQKILTTLLDIRDISKANKSSLSDRFEIYGDAKEILTLEYVLTYMQKSFPQKMVESVRPYSFTIGSNNREENIPGALASESCFYFGKLQICINPNGTDMVAEKIEIKYRSYFNDKPYWKYITRLVEIENYINESSGSSEFFDSIEISQASTAYDFYVTFLGFRIDYR